MSRLILVNGPPGIGKSTISRRYVAAHPGVMNLDIDVLRSLVGGWDQNFELVGASIRPVALAMIRSYLAQGNDVMMPQMLVDEHELRTFENAATASDGDFIHLVMMDDRDKMLQRFQQRETPGPWGAHVERIVEEGGGDELLLSYYDQLLQLVESCPEAVVIQTSAGNEDGAYAAVAAAVS